MPAKTVDEYVAALPDDRRGPMDSLRRAIRAAAPEADETIAYNMPAFRTRDGRFLVSYDAFKDELAPYLAGKGTIRFPADRPIPEELVTRLVAVRVAELSARDAAR